MNLLISGTAGFGDYQTYIRAMGVALSDVHAGETLHIYSVAPHKINNYAIEFVNKTENSLRARNVTIQLHRIKDYRDHDLDMAYFFCNNGETLPKFVHQVEGDGVPVLVFRP